MENVYGSNTKIHGRKNLHNFVVVKFATVQNFSKPFRKQWLHVFEVNEGRHILSMHDSNTYFYPMQVVQFTSLSYCWLFTFMSIIII